MSLAQFFLGFALLNNLTHSEILVVCLWWLFCSIAMLLYQYFSLKKERKATLPFSELLDQLLKWEEQGPIDLVGAWDERERTDISKCFEAAWEKGEFAGMKVRLPRYTEKKGGGSKEITNQKVGTDLWNQFRKLLEDELDGYEFQPCKERGYPDKRLVSETGMNYAFEEKATVPGDDNDGLRVNICSSTKRLRATFEPPINHIWAYLYYSYTRESELFVCTLHSLHLHFVEPGTPVSKKFAIETTKKLIKKSVENKNHKKVSFGNLPK